MYGSPPASSKDLNLPFPPPVSPFGHRKDDSDHHRHHHQQQQQQQMSSGLLRYRSAPSTLFGDACEDFLPARPSSPETETLFARFLTPDLRNEIREKPAAVAGGGAQFPPPTAAEVGGQQDGGFSPSSQMMYHSHHHQQQQNPMPTHGSMESPYRVVGSMAMETEQMKTGGDGGGNCSNLIRHSSSPAGLFAHLNVENGYAVMRGMNGFRNGNGEPGMPASRLKNQISFSSRQASSAGMMSQISEMGSEGMDGSSPEENSGGRCFIPGFPTVSWDDTPLISEGFSGLKRETKLVSSLNQTEHQIGDLRNSDMSNLDKFLQFQDSVPCKIRAKRGCATHPRSIAERVRRTRISERMRKLQELVPNMDKQTNTADMLELAVDYIKDLQRQVKMMSESRTSCTCSSSKHKSYPNPVV